MNKNSELQFILNNHLLENFYFQSKSLLQLNFELF